MPFDQRKAGLLDRMSPDSQSSLLGQELIRLWSAVDTLQASLASLNQEEAGGKEFFSATGRITAAAAGSHAHLLGEEKIPLGKTAHPLGFMMVLDGETAWSGEPGTTLYLADSGIDSIYRFASVPAQLITAGSYISPTLDGVTLEAEFGMALGCREGKGIDLVADGNFTAGSDLVATVFGYLE
jgi:hypothetical protein